jgi:parallel beta helix pectate lyase-like protein/chondroitinase B-like protein
MPLTVRPCLVTLALLLAFVPAGCAAPTSYVVDGGSDLARDANPGTQAAPWKTISHAAAHLKPGDTLIVKAGAYDELVTVSASGQKDKLVTLRAEAPHKARVKGFALEGDYISIEGFEITSDAPKAHGIFAGEAHYKTAREGCRMIGNYIHDIGGTAVISGEHALVKGNLMKNVLRGVFVNTGTLVEGNEVDTLRKQMREKNGKTIIQKTQYAFFAGDDITFRGNYFHGAPEAYLIKGMGVDFFVTWDAWIMGSSNRILIENNRCFNATHASEPEATKLKKSSHITYRNNLFVNTVYVGVLPKHWTHVTVEHNTFINCGAYPVWFQTPLQTKGAIVRNNLIAYWNRDKQVEKYGWLPAESGIANFALKDDAKATIDCDYNMFWGTKNREYGKHDFVAEPQFVDPDKGDFRLKPGSPGVDAGINVGITTDLVGTRRPQGKAPDVGAYELKESAE